MKKVLFICATHGDEAFSIPVLKQLERTHDSGVYGYDWIVGNPRALAQSERGYEGDLNRSAPGSREGGTYELRRAAEIIELSHQYEQLIDIHGTVADGGVVTIIPLPTKANLSLAAACDVACNVVWYSRKSKLAGPLAQHAACSAIELECGPKNNPRIADELYWVLARFLERRKAVALPPVSDSTFYDVYGVLRGKVDRSLRDFQQAQVSGEKFYPFMSNNQYADIACYKMRKVGAPELELYAARFADDGDRLLER